MTASELIAEARRYIGYRAHGFHDSEFGKTVGHPGQPWDGSFLEVAARRSNHSYDQIPSLISTAAAMQQFVQRGRFFRVRPQAGDIAFFAFPADGVIGQIHIGLVSSTRKTAFASVEGMGDPRRKGEIPTNDWVVEVERYTSDVIGYGRPIFKVPKHPSYQGKNHTSPKLAASQLVYGTSRPQHVLLQLALREAIGDNGWRPGVFDAATAAAMREFERRNGYVHGNGRAIDPTILTKLGELTGVFQA